MASSDQDFLGELRLARNLTTTAQVAAGSWLMLAGIIFLLGGPLSINLGEWGVVVALASGLYFLAVLGSVVELLGGSGDQGGTYVLVLEILNDVWSFLTGWAVLAGSGALLAALIKSTTILTSDLISGSANYQIAIALGLLFLLLILRVQKLFPWLLPYHRLAPIVLLALVVLLLSALPQVDWFLYRDWPRLRADTFGQGLLRLSLSYILFEMILLSKEQVQLPGKHVPAAIWVVLVAWVAFSALGLAIFAGLNLPQGVPFHLAVFLGLVRGSAWPGWLIWGFSFLAVIAAAGASLAVMVQQTDLLSRKGSLPDIFQRKFTRLEIPLPLFGWVLLLVVPLLLFAPVTWLLDFSSGMFLVVIVLLNFAAIYSYRREPDRRRVFRIPFSPLVPSLVIAISIFLARVMPDTALIGSIIWLGLGGILYLVYSRHHQIDAQEGEIVFGHQTHHGEHKSKFRILVPIRPGNERHPILKLAAALASHEGGEVLPLQVIPVPDPMAVEEGKRMARERNMLFQWSMRVGGRQDVPVLPITRLARSVTDGIIDTSIEEKCNLVLIPWHARQDDAENAVSPKLQELVANLPCDVALLTAEEQPEEDEPAENGDGANGQGGAAEEFHPRRILVPTSGGPNAPLAVRLALILAKEHQAQVEVVYVANPDAEKGDILEGEQRIQNTLDAMGEQAIDLFRDDGRNGGGASETSVNDIPVLGRVIFDEDVIDGLVRASADYDLLLMGASEEKLIDQMLFGELPEQVAQQSAAPVIIVRRYIGLPRFWLTKAWYSLTSSLPALPKDEQIDVYRNIHSGARPDVDFFVMISLSALIATFGLLQSSSAVIIGAMLVAPLFSPLLAIALSIVQGNIRLLSLASESALKGLALVLLVAFLLAYVTPLKTMTPEMLARTEPNIYDLAVALASGAAGAYAAARKDVASSLPGVAIAVALVPPVAVIGIGLSRGDFAVALGATLLILTNLIAIALSGAVVFLLLGFRPGTSDTRERHLRRAFMATAVLSLLISIPLVWIFYQSVQTARTRQIILKAVEERMEGISGIELISEDEVTFDEGQEELVVTVPLYTRGEVPEAFALDLSQDLAEAVNKPVRVRLVTLPLVEFNP